ncbi:fumarate hydratase C-terminal domain-containing protein [Klebsiella variicola subsp. variicola]|nr:fumarate hydratase C-terminal domain-containing protein [Klebsiella variicola subsp. variicola]
MKVNLNQPMSEILALLSQYPVSTRLSLSGTIIVARDIAHAKLKELIDSGEALPQYVKDHPIYYAGPARHRTVTPPALWDRPPQGAWILR